MKRWRRGDWTWQPPGLTVRVPIPAWLGARIAAHAIAERSLDDDMLGWQACADPRCKECPEMARRHPERFRWNVS